MANDITLKLRFDTQQADRAVQAVSAQLRSLKEHAAGIEGPMAAGASSAKAVAAAVGDLKRGNPTLRELRNLARELDDALEDAADPATRQAFAAMRGELGRMEAEMRKTVRTASSGPPGGLMSRIGGQVRGRLGIDTDDVAAAGGMGQAMIGGLAMGAATAGVSAAIGAASAAVAGLGRAMKDAVAVGMEFDATMSKVQAKSGASAMQLEQLREQAIALGGSTTFSASEVAAAMVELGAAGMSTEQIMAAVPGVLSAAASEGMGLADAATVMSDTLTQFGLSADQSARVADVLAQGAASSSADIGQMGHSLRYAAPAAASLGMSLEDTTAAVMGLAAAGIRGEQAGTTLRGGLLQIVNPGKQAADAMERIGFTITDAQGKVKPFSQIIGELARKTDTMTEAERTRTVAQIVGTEASSGFLALMRQGQDVLEGYREGLDNATGAAERMADIQTDNLKGDLEELGGAWESLQIAFAESNMDTMRTAVQTLTEVLQLFQGTTADATEALKEMRTQASLTNEISALAKELENLSNKKKLTKEQAERLAEVQRRLAELSPGLITGFDNQGRAIVAYSNKVWEAVRANKELAKAATEAARVAAMKQYIEGKDRYDRAVRATGGDRDALAEVMGGREASNRILGATVANPLLGLATGILEYRRLRNTNPMAEAAREGLEGATQQQAAIVSLASTFAAQAEANTISLNQVITYFRGAGYANPAAIAVQVYEALQAQLASADPDPDPDPDPDTDTPTGGSGRSSRSPHPQGPSAEELARREEAAQRLRVQLMEESTAKRIALLEQEHAAHLETIAKSGKSEEERTAMVAEADAWLAREKEKVHSDERAKAFAESEEDARREDERARLKGKTEEEILQRRMSRIQREIDGETAGSERKAQLEDDLDGLRVQLERAHKERIDRMAALQREQLEAMRTAARTLASDMAEQQAAEERRELARLQGIARRNPNDEAAQQAVRDYESQMRRSQIQRDMELRRSAINDAYTNEEARIKASGATQAEIGVRLFQLSAKWIADLDALKRETDTKTYEAETQDQQARDAAQEERRRRIIEKRQQMVERFAQVADQVGQWLFDRERMRMEEQARAEQAHFDERQQRIDADEQAAYDQLDAETGRKRALSAEEQAYENRRATIAAEAEKKRQKLQDERDKAEKRRARDQAIFEKKQAAWKIFLSTAIGVASALSNPLTAAMVPKIIAEGAVALAFVAAQPLPKFARGVTGFTGGVALVGEKGPELVTLGRGSNVITNENTRRLVGAAGDPATLDARLAMQARLVERMAMMAPAPQYLVAQQAAAFDPRIVEALNRLEARFAGVEGGFDRLAERIQDVEFHQSGTEMRATLVAEHDRQSQLRTPAPI